MSNSSTRSCHQVNSRVNIQDGKLMFSANCRGRETRKDPTAVKRRQHGGLGRLTKEERVKILFPVERMTNLQSQTARMSAKHMKVHY